MRYAEVVVDIAHSAVDRRYTYRIPAELSVSLGQHVLVPFGQGAKPKEGFVVSFVETPDREDSRIKSILRVIEPYPVLLPEQIALAEWMQASYHCLFIDALACMIPAALRGQRIHEKKERVVALNNSTDLALEIAKLRSQKQRELVTFLQEANLPFSVKDLNGYFPNVSPVVRALLDKGILVETQETVFRRPSRLIAKTKRHILSPEQSDAVLHISNALQNATGETMVLHGVTGSGKTEVYLHAIEHCLSLGRQAIVLVPEISLTPQTVGRFAERFGDKIAVLHSRLSAGERFDEWRRIRLGLVNIVIGARSAVFVYDWNIYTWRPIHPKSPYAGKSLTIEPTRQVEGGMLLAWGDHIMGHYPNLPEGVREEQRLIEERTLPFTENVWSREKALTWEEFRPKMEAVAALYEAFRNNK